MAESQNDLSMPLNYTRFGCSDNPTATVVLLHGAGASAEQFIARKKLFKAAMPQASFMAINGSFKVEVDNQPGFTWFSGDAEESKSSIGGLTALLKRQTRANEKIALFGFSQGGFMATALMLSAPDLAQHAILHSSAIAQVPDVTADSGRLRTVDTYISVDDPYLRTPMVAMLPLHYLGSARFRRAGVRSKTHWGYGFGHTMTERSISRACGILSLRLGLSS